MALSTRELFLILRARDEASRVLRGFEQNVKGLSAAQQKAIQRQNAIGTALTSTGVAMIGLGVLGLKFIGSSVKAFTDYQKQVALTRTQVDETGVSLKQLSDIGKRVGNEIGVPFETLQGSLYDIFSSMNISVKDSEVVLRAFAKTAVAGQVDIQTAGRATIAIMNAFHVPISRVNDVMDFQFQLVRKGVGTYQQFAETIGRSIPSAARAGQSYQQLGGMLAFLTRNGLSAAMATASAGRALDAISNPKTVSNLGKLGDIVGAVLGPKGMQKMAQDAGMSLKDFTKSLGVNALDAKGKFRPLVDIINEMQQKLAGLSDPQRAAVLQSLFKGAGGTIQARRFFDLVLKSGAAAKQFTQLTQDMYRATGAADSAYRTMADTAAARTQVLKNRWQIFKVNLGEQFLPVIIKLVSWVNKLFEAWNKLSPGVQRFIGYALGIISVLLVLTGIVLSIAGVFLLFSAAATAAGISLGTIAIVVGSVIAAVIAVIAVVILMVKYWDAIKRITMDVVHWIGDAAVAAFHAVASAINTVAGPVIRGLISAFKAVRDWTLGKIIPAFHAFTDWFNKNLMPIVRDAVSFFKSKWNELKEWWVSIWKAIAETAKAVWNPLLSFLKGTWNFLSASFKRTGDVLVHIWDDAWRVVVNITKVAHNILKQLFAFFTTLIEKLWYIFGGSLVHVIKAAWELIKGVVGGALQIIEGILQVFIGVITLHWGLVWQGIKKIAEGIWNIIKGLWNALMQALMAPLGALGRLAKTAWDAVSSAFKKAIDFLKPILTPFKVLIEAIGKALGFIKDIAEGVGKAIRSIGAAFSAIVGAVGAAADKILGFTRSVLGAKDAVAKFKYTATGFAGGSSGGAATSPGGRSYPKLAAGGRFHPGLTMVGEKGPELLMFDRPGYIWNATTSARLLRAYMQTRDFLPTTGTSYYKGASYGNKMGAADVHQTFNITTQEIDPRKHSADLGWMIGQRVGA